MGGCCSCHVSIVGKVHDEEYECSHHNVASFERGGAQVTLNGSSKFASMYTQKGTKGVNQDAMTVWEVRLIFMNLLAILFGIMGKLNASSIVIDL